MLLKKAFVGYWKIIATESFIDKAELLNALKVFTGLNAIPI